MKLKQIGMGFYESNGTHGMPIIQLDLVCNCFSLQYGYHVLYWLFENHKSTFLCSLCCYFVNLASCELPLCLYRHENQLPKRYATNVWNSLHEITVLCKANAYSPIKYYDDFPVLLDPSCVITLLPKSLELTKMTELLSLSRWAFHPQIILECGLVCYMWLESSSCSE